MRPSDHVLGDLLDLDQVNERLWRACAPVAAEASDGAVVLTVPFQCQKPGGSIQADAAVPRRNLRLWLRAYGGMAVRLSLCAEGEPPPGDSDMLERRLDQEPLAPIATADGWEMRDGAGRVRATVTVREGPPSHPWSTLLPPNEEALLLTVLPDGTTAVPLCGRDQFFPRSHDAFGLAYAARDGAPLRWLCGLHARPDEHFVGTGERFARMDLAGRTLVLENRDGLGVNNRRAYKNVPFVASSRPYGLFLHTSTRVRLSLADHSTRAVQAMVPEPQLDLFLIGGGSVERVLHGYRSLSGFPRTVPRWSYGTWMSRMTYFTAAEVEGIAGRLRREGFPCDVLHLDTGWFARDWVCEWTFSSERFPDPAGFMARLAAQGFRTTLWQTPNIGRGNRWYDEASARGWLPPRTGVAERSLSDFGAEQADAQIDFSNPEAVTWYRGLLRGLFRLGAAAIKTDFGEELAADAQWRNVPPARMRNLYALLYQRAAYDETVAATGEGIIWARAGWAGCQRYPLHWGGDCAATWDGMAGSLRGGLHLGLSGFAFWSHDVPGFHGVPDFMNSRPAPLLYLRWTQFGVLSSHLRYHGTSAREPWEYPEVADAVRRWLRLRYALIPYLEAQAERCCASGLPMLRALLLADDRDPACWAIDDQYLLGDDLLVAPVMNDDGVRDVYLPRGAWTDAWTGEVHEGGTWLRGLRFQPERCGLWLRRGARIPVYPHAVAHTGEMDPRQVRELVVDDGFRGLPASLLGPLIGL